MADKIVVTEKIFKDGECPKCYKCLKPALEIQIYCNCGCQEVWCQPCYYNHYKNFAIRATMNNFINSDSEESVMKLLGLKDHEYTQPTNQADGLS